MIAIQLHNTETEEIIGTVSPIDTNIDFDKFQDEVYTKWKSFNSNPENVEDYTIEDFIDFHNANSELIIDYVIVDFIQL